MKCDAEVNDANGDGGQYQIPKLLHKLYLCAQIYKAPGPTGEEASLPSESCFADTFKMFRQ